MLELYEYGRASEWQCNRYMFELSIAHYIQATFGERAANTNSEKVTNNLI